MCKTGAFWFADRERRKKPSDTGSVQHWQGGILKAAFNMGLNFLPGIELSGCILIMTLIPTD